MSQTITQNTATDLVTILTETDGTPATGLVFSDVNCVFRKEGASSFTSKTLDGTNFTEIGNGVYTINFDAGELDTLGSFTWVVNGTGLTQYVGVSTITTTVSSSSPVTLDTCVVTGQLYSVTGSPIEGAAISVRVIGMPTLIGQVGISEDLVTAETDANGQFSIELVRLAQVDVMIPEINYRRTLTVPNSASADLFVGIP